jgi:hypothetical protein
MVKLAVVQISVPNPTSTTKEDREVSVSCSATLDPNGRFTLTLPDHLSEVAKAMTLPAGVSWDPARVHTRLQGKVLDTLKNAVAEMLKGLRDESRLLAAIKTDHVLLGAAQPQPQSAPA